MSRAKVVARAAWRCLWHPGTEVSTLASVDGGWRLSGRADLEFAEGPATFRYRIDCTSGWEPRLAQIVLRTPSASRRLEIVADERHAWTIGGFRNPDLQGCIDLDFTATPATNTLALKRLDLPVGGRQEIRTAWFMLPDLEGRAIRQRYTRVAERHYVYEGFHNNFVGEFDVDDAGLVTNYVASWERLPHPRARRRASGKGTRPQQRINP